MNKTIKKTLINISKFAAKKVYEKNISILSTQFSLSEKGGIQVLAIAGTKITSISDWFWNILLLSSGGTKLTAKISADRILNSKEYKKWRDYLKPLLVTGHSKGGCPALEIQRRIVGTYCVAFCPPPCFRRPVPKLKDTIIITDHDDIVPYLGSLSFQLPECDRIKLPRNQKWWNLFARIKDHPMDSIIESMKDEEKK